MHIQKMVSLGLEKKLSVLGCDLSESYNGPSEFESNNHLKANGFDAQKAKMAINKYYEY